MSDKVLELEKLQLEKSRSKKESMSFYDSLVKRAFSRSFNLNVVTVSGLYEMGLHIDEDRKKNSEGKEFNSFFSPESLSKFLTNKLENFFDILPSEEEKNFLENLNKCRMLFSLDSGELNDDISIEHVAQMKEFIKFFPHFKSDELPPQYKKIHLGDFNNPLIFSCVAKVCAQSGIKVLDNVLKEKSKDIDSFGISMFQTALSSAMLQLIIGVGFDFYIDMDGFLNHIKAEKEIQRLKNSWCSTESYPWYNQEAFQSLTDELKTTVNKDVAKELVKKISKNDRKTKVLVANSREKVQGLKSVFPHFSEVIDYIDAFLAIQEKTTKLFYFPPILLNGEPGIGKTFFLLKLAELCNVDFHVENMASVTTGARFTGTEAHWGTSSEGIVLNLLLNKPHLNNLVLLDELDKSGDRGNSRNPTLSLLALLERGTAKEFKDVSINLAVDASNFIWLASSNELTTINSALLSRFKIFNVRNPNRDERKLLTQSIYQQMIKDNQWDNYFSFEIKENVLDYVVDTVDGGSARETKKILQAALSLAAKESKTELAESHFIHTSIQQPKIGF